MLDAGCGFGVITFALLEALRQRNFDYKNVDAFDLTPAMLQRFQETLEVRGVTRVQLFQADVLALEGLPPAWTNYDLILSASMLEYLPKRDLGRALLGLRARMSPPWSDPCADHEEDSGNKSSHRVVVARRTLYQERTAAGLQRGRFSEPRIQAISLALRLAEPCDVRCGSDRWLAATKTGCGAATSQDRKLSESFGFLCSWTANPIAR